MWLRLGIALAIGLLIGTEREQRGDSEPDGQKVAGIRTFALVSLLGGTAAVLGSAPLLVVAGLAVVALAVAGYALGGGRDRGITTEVALQIAYLLGALAQKDPVLASGLAVVVTILLVGRTRLHDFSQRLLTEEELHDGLLLLAAALVVLPLAPDRALGPYATVNPRTLWKLAVLVMAISSAGYVAIRIFGPKLGLPLAGLAGGFVSSTATIGSMGARMRATPALAGAASAGAVLSTVSTIIVLVTVLGATSMPVLRQMRWPLLLAGAAAVVYGAVFAWRARKEAPPPREAASGRAFSVKTAILFALTVSAVMVLSAALHARFGRAGLVIATLAAGLADAHAPAISTAALVASGQLEADAAVLPILAGVSSNTLSKLAAALATGGWRFALRVGPGLLLVAGATWLGWLLK